MTYSRPKPKRPQKASGPLSKGLVLGLPMTEGGGNPFDYSGYGNNGTLNNGVTWVNSPFGQALHFVHGTSTSVEFAKYTLQGNFTIAIWAKQTSAGVIGMMMTYSNVPTASNSFYMEVSASGQFGALIDGANLDFCTISPTVTDWNHYVITYSGTSLKFYLNGSAGGTFTRTLVSGTNYLHLGAYWSTIIDTSYTWGGDIASYSQYNRNFSAGEVAALYADSWQMFRPRRRTIFVPAAAPPAGAQVWAYLDTEGSGGFCDMDMGAM